MNWLYEKRVVLTGASSGIGKGLAERLVRQYRCRVIGVGRNEERLKAVQAELGERFTYAAFDASKKENWQAFAKTIDGVDLLVNDAGILPPFRRFEAFSPEQAEEIMAINYFAAVYADHALFPLLGQSKTPAIVNIASSAGLCPLPGISQYAASKAALKSYTECLMAEHPDWYIACILPGFTKTNIFRSQNSDINDSKLVAAIAMDCEKMVGKIVKAIAKKKKRKVFGLDAKGMDFLYHVAPVQGTRLAGDLMKLSGQKLFDELYRE